MSGCFMGDSIPRRRAADRRCAHDRAPGRCWVLGCPHKAAASAPEAARSPASVLTGSEAGGGAAEPEIGPEKGAQAVESRGAGALPPGVYVLIDDRWRDVKTVMGLEAMARSMLRIEEMSAEEFQEVYGQKRESQDAEDHALDFKPVSGIKPGRTYFDKVKIEVLHPTAPCLIPVWAQAIEAANIRPLPLASASDCAGCGAVAMVAGGSCGRCGRGSDG